MRDTVGLVTAKGRYQVTIFDGPEPSVFYTDELSETMPTPGLYTAMDGKFVVAIKEVEEDEDTGLPGQ